MTDTAETTELRCQPHRTAGPSPCPRRPPLLNWLRFSGCCRRAGGAPRVLTPASAGSSRDAASSCPTSATAPTRRPATSCPTVSAPPACPAAPSGLARGCCIVRDGSGKAAAGMCCAQRSAQLQPILPLRHSAVVLSQPAATWLPAPLRLEGWAQPATRGTAASLPSLAWQQGGRRAGLAPARQHEGQPSSHGRCLSPQPWSPDVLPTAQQTRCPPGPPHHPHPHPPTRPTHPQHTGFLKFVVSNVKDLELLLMHNRKYCAEIAHNVSTLKRKAIVERAAEVRAAAQRPAGATLLLLQRLPRLSACVCGERCEGPEAAPAG